MIAVFRKMIYGIKNKDADNDVRQADDFSLEIIPLAGVFFIVCAS